jgi:multicomponent Na+:H+ antiporter subunit A
VITAGGGLSLLAGFVLFVDAAGTARLSEIGPITGSTANAAAVLILVAAATKSAQFPFHVWLPGAMAAPTPVSAYLHSATMVKAGVILVAVIAPAFQDSDVWKPLGLSFGLATMVWGAVGALRHVDAKLILAWGTVSQLGLLISLLAIGTPKATFAAISILVAHAVFKAALFMVVGEVDVRVGTRNINELSGLRRAMPATFAVALISGASMAGIPPLLGFPAKEAAIEAALGLSGSEFLVVGGLIIGGSVLTVAYTTRLLIGHVRPAPNRWPNVRSRRVARCRCPRWRWRQPPCWVSSHSGG